MKSCFAYRETVNDDNSITKECNALSELVCAKRKCSFYKTHEKIKREQYKADRRNKEVGIGK